MNAYDVSQDRSFSCNQTTASALPPGKKLFAAVGCSGDAELLLRAARARPDCPPNVEAVTGLSVGAKLRDAGGKEIPLNSTYWSTVWVIIY